MKELDPEKLIELYNSRVLKWRQKAEKAELEADQLRKQNYALRRMLHEQNL